MYLLGREKSKHVFAGTCPGGWVTVLPAGTGRYTILWPEADTTD